MIKKVVEQINKNLKGKLLFLTQYGSHLYGLNTENSDLDFRGVYIAHIDDLILHKDEDELNQEMLIQSGITEKKVDVKLFSLQKFIKLCSKADTNALDLLFSFNCTHVEHYIENAEIMEMLLGLRNKLINTDRLESPITYAYKQAVKYGIKGKRRQVLLDIIESINSFDNKPYCNTTLQIHHMLETDDYIKPLKNLIDDTYVKIEELDNKGKQEKYLFVCGIYHQFNLDLKTFKQRIQDKIDKEYTSQRTINAADGNDWKALSHALRILQEMTELLSIGNIRFPLVDRGFLLQVKLGQVDRQIVDDLFEKTFNIITSQIKMNNLQWKYDEQFWDKQILKIVKENM